MSRRTALQSGTTLELEIEKAVAGGRMLARHEGRVVFVRGAIPGERVRARVERVARDVAFASTTDVLSGVPERRETTSDPTCGGSVYAHVAYDAQLRLKGSIVRDAFSRLARIEVGSEIPLTGSPERGYRMRARLHAGGAILGFYREGTHELCDPAGTGQLLPGSCAVLEAIATAIRPEGLRAVESVELVENVAADQRVVHVELSARDVGPLLSGLAKVHGLTGVTYRRPGDHAAVLLRGHGSVADSLSSLVPVTGQAGAISVSRKATSFFQGNRFLVGALIAAVTRRVLPGRVLDLYAGVGAFAVAIAAGGRGPVTAVEWDRSSVTDLRANAAAAAHAIDVVHAGVEEYLARETADVSTCIVDPPRSGLSAETSSALCGLHPARVVYVSCDVATLARDVARLRAAGYELRDLEAFDMFPNTAHIESLAVLDR